mmetsp:Transcript_60232/g.161624  ORF Transcript_60232/g.161624 Transcript_60232/m.161624 type:complete len:301 (-) Transcript_60232:63-965(-)
MPAAILDSFVHARPECLHGVRRTLKRTPSTHDPGPAALPPAPAALARGPDPDLEVLDEVVQELRGFLSEANCDPLPLKTLVPAVAAQAAFVSFEGRDRREGIDGHSTEALDHIHHVISTGGHTVIPFHSRRLRLEPGVVILGVFRALDLCQQLQHVADLLLRAERHQCPPPSTMRHWRQVTAGPQRIKDLRGHDLRQLVPGDARGNQLRLCRRCSLLVLVMCLGLLLQRHARHEGRHNGLCAGQRLVSELHGMLQDGGVPLRHRRGLFAHHCTYAVKNGLGFDCGNPLSLTLRGILRHHR